MNILVLMSTFNGALYVSEQIESILGQQFDGEIRLLIRDDGSSDHTVDMVRSFNDPRIELLTGQRQANFIALADQGGRTDTL